MNPSDFTEPDYHISTRSGADNNCVEAAVKVIGTALRDSKDRKGPVLYFKPSSWAGFIRAVKDDEFQPAR